MLKNNKINMALALIIAIVLWAYVFGDVNPSSTDTIKNVPITYLNKEILDDEGLVMLSTSAETVNISISGARRVIGSLKATDFKVVADFDGLVTGENSVKLRASGPDNVSIDSISIKRITVVIDEEVTLKKPVTAVIINQNSDETEPYIVQVNSDSVSVTGAKTLVDSIVELRAPLDASKVGNEMKAFNVELEPIDSNGALVEGVTLSESNASVTAVLLNKKTVPLKVTVVDSEVQTVERVVNIPKIITVKGMNSVLDSVQFINCSPLDISEIYENTTVELEPILPDGVEIALDSKKLSATVTVKDAATKEFTFNEDNITLDGISEDVSAVISPVDITITATGYGTVINSLKNEDFVLSADITDLEDGTHTVALVCVCNQALASLDYMPKEIEVTIEKAAVS